MNKKQTRLIAKILGLLLALMMIIGVCAPAMAATVDKEVTKTDKGSITVTSNESGWTATAYKVIDVNFDFENQQPKEPVYTWNESVANWMRGSEQQTAGFSRYVGENNDNSVTKVFQDVQANSDAIKKFTDELAAEIGKGSSGSLGSLNAAGTGTEGNKSATIPNLDMGGYLVLIKQNETAAAGIAATRIYAPGFVSIYPSYENNSWVLKNATVEMIVKSSDPIIQKTVNKTTVAIGDTVTYTLEIDVPKYPAKADHKTFCFGDILPAGLQLVESSIKIHSSDPSNTTQPQQDINNSFTKSTTVNKTGADFEYSVADASTITHSKIWVTYDATVVTAAYEKRDNLKNIAYMQYDKNPYDGKKDVTEKLANTQIYTYGIKFVKEGEKVGEKVGESEEKLGGAQFVLKKGNQEVKLAKDETNGFYYPSVNGTATLESAETTGEILIKGLDVGTYTLEETKAPAGYTLPKNATITVTLKDGDNTSNAAADGALDNNQATKAEGAIVKANSGAIDGTTNWQFNFTITNSKSNFNLPITGGVGTVLFTVAGIMVMAGAVVLMTYAIRRKKRSSMK